METYGYDLINTLAKQDPQAIRVGRSAFGRSLWAFRVGDGKGMLLFGAIHAREWCTVPIVWQAYLDYRTLWLASDGTLPGADFVPLSNPDGVELALHGLSTAPVSVRRYLAEINKGVDFSLWKANGRGVDLNVNFDAGWGKGLGNRFSPSPSSYVGMYPGSEAETAALVDLTLAQGYKGVLAYHCKGEVAYYGYVAPDGDRTLACHSERIALALCKQWGYTPTPSVGSHGGYKDWYATRYPQGACLTVEVGRDEYPHPYPAWDVDRLVALHRGDAARLEKEIWTTST